MALTANEKVRGQSPVQDPDGRLIVVGPDGVPIGGGGGGSDPLSDGSDAGALPTKTLWVAGADGSILRGLRVDSSGRARVVVEGTPAVSVSNFPATQPVSGTVAVSNFPATQPVSGTVTASGPLTDTQLRATPVPVSGTVTANAGSGTMAVSGPLTDTQLRATPVPVSGTVTASGPLTDTQLRASAVPVTATGNVANAASDSGNPVKTGGKATWPAIPTLVATGQRVDSYSDLSGASIVRKRPLASYTATYRLVSATAGTRVITSAALTANTNKQLATIYHTGSATKRVQIKYVDVIFNSLATVAGLIEWELVPLSATTAPSGGTAITPGKHDPGDGAAEAACQSAPTTQGSVVAADSPVGMAWSNNLGITGAAGTTNPIPGASRCILWDSRSDSDGKDLIMPAATACGFGVSVRSTGASQVGYTATIIFTEE